MAAAVRILLKEGELPALLDDSPTALAIEEALPLEGVTNRWGEEVYFTIPVHVEEAPDARQDMGVGELGYWPVGAAFCIFFGPAPAGIGPLPRAYNNVDPFGRIETGEEAVKEMLAKVRDGETVRVVAAWRGAEPPRGRHASRPPHAVACSLSDERRVEPT